ncbi:hypothetical protein BJV78DRAFT_1222906 [Lactifluus subvellereus]|nr:hypothetical protein BJV78DRAFT_1222906 [Lactifluus subvellereus]
MDSSCPLRVGKRRFCRTRLLLPENPIEEFVMEQVARILARALKAVWDPGGHLGMASRIYPTT